MASKLPAVYTYVTEEEKKALEMLAQLEGRSFSGVLRLAVVQLLKERGLLLESINDQGELVQEVVIPDLQQGRGEK